MRKRALRAHWAIVDRYDSRGSTPDLYPSKVAAVRAARREIGLCYPPPTLSVVRVSFDEDTEIVIGGET